MEKLNVRSHSWLSDNLSWASVIVELINAFDDLGHNTYVVSTNGMNEGLFKKKNKMIDSVLGLQGFGPGKKQIDLEVVYTVPINFKSRFLPNSKHKCAIYNYEFLHMPQGWKKHYKDADFYFPSSNFAAEIFYRNDFPIDKTFVIPHGVDVEKFNSFVQPLKLNTKKKYRFLSVSAPHERKKLHILLDVFCKTFCKNDDVCLVLKTKIYKHSDGIFDARTNPKGRKQFEIVLGDIFIDLVKKYGKNMPEIEVIDKRIDNMGSLYNACHAHITTTGSECWMVPGAESAASGGADGKGMINIAPNYSGHLHFLNPKNALLIDCKLVSAKREEQYWHFDKRNKSCEPDPRHTSELMLKAYKEREMLLEKFRPEVEKTVKQFSWKNSAQMIIDAVNGKLSPYIPGTYNVWPE